MSGTSRSRAYRSVAGKSRLGDVTWMRSPRRDDALHARAVPVGARLAQPRGLALLASPRSAADGPRGRAVQPRAQPARQALRSGAAGVLPSFPRTISPSSPSTWLANTASRG